MVRVKLPLQVPTLNVLLQLLFGVRAILLATNVLKAFLITTRIPKNASSAQRIQLGKLLKSSV
jgi:hypothetical protein